MKILEHNVETGEVVERDATAEEIATAEATIAANAAERAELEIKAVAKAAILERLGITEAEAKLLLA